MSSPTHTDWNQRAAKSSVHCVGSCQRDHGNGHQGHNPWISFRALHCNNSCSSHNSHLNSDYGWPPSRRPKQFTGLCRTREPTAALDGQFCKPGGTTVNLFLALVLSFADLHQRGLLLSSFCCTSHGELLHHAPFQRIYGRSWSGSPRKSNF